MNGVFVTDDSMISGVEEATNPGRMEIVSDSPCILLDGAHNIACMKVLRDTLENDFEYDNLVLVLGVLSDKNIEEMLKIIVPIADDVVVTKSKNERAYDPNVLKDKIEKLGFKNKIFVKNEIGEAVDYAKSIAKKTDLICVTGSLFTVGEARDVLF
jgi:dihydrofolate synthase/folylpolyglutamate synthase